MASLVEQLIRAVTRAPTQLRLVLLGYSASIPPQSASSVLVERLAVLDQSDFFNW